MNKILLWLLLSAAAVAGTVFFVVAVWAAYFLCLAYGLG